MMNNVKYYKPAVVAAFIMYLVFTFFIIDPGHNWGGDFALYISQAKAIYEGNTMQLFEASKESCAKTYMVINPDLYPPGFPLLLLPLYAFYGVNLYVFKLIGILCYAGCIVCIGYFFKKQFGEQESLLMLLFFGSSAFFISFNNNIIADIPVFFFALLSLNLIRFYLPGKLASKIFKGIALGILFSFGYFIKSLCVSLIAAYFIYEFLLVVKLYFSKKVILADRIYEVASAFIVFITLVLITERMYPSAGSDYFSKMENMGLSQMLYNLAYYFNAPKWFLFHSYLFWFITLPFVFYGVVIRFNKDHFFLLFIVLHVIMIIIWPFQAGLRYAFFIVPFYFYFSMHGFRKVFTLLANGGFLAYRNFAFVVICAYSIYNSTLLSANTERFSGDEIHTPAARELFRFVRTKTNPEEQFIFFKPNVLRLFCERESFYQVSTEGIRNSDATYWIHWKDDALADTTGLPVMLRNNEFTVYQLK